MLLFLSNLQQQSYSICMSALTDREIMKRSEDFEMYDDTI